MKKSHNCRYVILLLLGVILIVGSCDRSTEDVTAPESPIVTGQSSSLINCSSTCVTPPSGLVSWWDGDAVSGSTVEDIQSSNNGFLQYGATVASGYVGQALSFDGNNDQVNIPNRSSMRLSQFTIDAWFYANEVTEIDPLAGIPIKTIVMYGYTNADGKNTALDVTNGVLRFGIRGYGSQFEDLVGQTPIGSNEWHFAAVTYDGTTAILYLDGQEEDRKDVTIDISLNSRILIGRYQNPKNLNYCCGLDGLVDEVELFNRALSQSEIQALYNAGSAGKCKP